VTARTPTTRPLIKTHFYGDGCDPPHVEMYRCLSCYKESPVGEWGERGMTCPLCGHVYDDHCVMQAQERC
jgi:hypothetical protein